MIGPRKATQSKSSKNISQLSGIISGLSAEEQLISSEPKDYSKIKSDVGNLLNTTEKLQAEVIRQSNEVVRQAGDIKQSNALIIFGFIVLLVMVAAMVIEMGFNLNSTYGSFQNTLSDLEFQLIKSEASKSEGKPFTCVYIKGGLKCQP